jgi:hypothetical protein
MKRQLSFAVCVAESFYPDLKENFVGHVQN